MRALAGITVVLAILAAGCGRGAPQADPTDAGPSEVASAAPSEAASLTPSPEPSITPSPTAASEPAEASEEPSDSQGEPVVVEAWFVRDGSRGPWVEPEEISLPPGTVGVARAAFEEVITGEPTAPGLWTMAPAGTEVLGVNRKGDLLILDVSDEISSKGTGSAGEIAFAEQLAHTAAQFPGVRGVRLLVEGEPIMWLWGHVDWSQPIEPDEFAISPVVITSPAHGETVPVGRVTFTGTANTFEATVELRLVGPTGNVVRQGFTTATCGSGCRGDWTHTFKIDHPGRWRLVAAESDPSGGEGGPPFEVGRVFVVE